MPEQAIWPAIASSFIRHGGSWRKAYRLWPHTHTGYSQLLDGHPEEVLTIASIFDLSAEIALEEVGLADLSPSLTDDLRQVLALRIDRISHACNVTC